ncbi:glycosyltransferase family 4 protein [Shewanella baltica]|uniref:glycosyltransferase family 4 protein n=1 Tax=Shewanella baltica TaxID=62322 RepID=UPI002872A5A2|nr:glycosyltransferase family 4 protein [Shewanella baltica]MDR9765628.1 glycosyltransferase family 4 protein [Shewanella baltica]
MRLIYLHQYFRKPSMNGGIRSYEFAKRLAASKHDVVVVTSDNENVFNGWKIEQLDGFEVHWVSVTYDNSFGFLRRIWSFFKFLVFSSIHICSLKSDKLFVTSTPLTVAIPAIIYKFIKRKPYVFEVRDVWPEVPIALGVIKNKFLIQVAFFLEKLAYKNATHIVALSPDMRNSVLHRCGNTPVTVISNAADCHLFNLPLLTDDVLLRELKNIKNKHQKVVFYTGTLGVVNNLRSFIKLASYSNSEIGFVIIGQGKEEAELKKYATDLSVLDDRLYFLPSVNKNQLSFVHSTFDMATSTVLPIDALYANSANKVFDAFAAGTPLLINHAGWIKDLIERTDCGLVINNSPTFDDYNVLKNFLFSGERYEKARVASLDLGSNEYNRENLFKKLIAVIEGEKK